MIASKKSKRTPPVERELQICKRLKETRERLRLTQLEFASQVGIKRQRLASYEEGRAPLRFDLALRICRQFIISERWLAIGMGDARLLMDLSSDHSINKISPDTSFGMAFDQVLGERYEALSKEYDGAFRIKIHPNEGMPYIKNLFLLMVERWCATLKPDEIHIYLMQLIEIGEEIIQARVQTGSLPSVQNLQDEKGNYYIAGLADGTDLSESEENNLTGDSLKGNNAAVKSERSEIEKLIEDVKRKAAKPGAKAELARELDVAPARISEWLSGKKEPGGDYALRLRNWVYPPKQK